MRVLLINSYYPYPYSRNEHTYNRIWPPLSLMNCAAILEKEGHQPAILDAHALRIKPRNITKFIGGYHKIFVSSSPLDKWQCPNIDISTFLETVKHIRESTGEVYLMGYHGTVEPDRVLDSTGARAVIKGEPEYTVAEICRSIPISGVRGVAFKDNGKVISTPAREPLDLKSLPLPAFHLLDFKNYFYEILGRDFALFEISRGCYHRCTFCNKIMYGEGVRTKSREQIFEEVALAVEKYKIRNGYFIDLDFLSDREKAEDLCQHLIEKGYRFKWACQTRPDLLDTGILRRMKRAGCSLIHMGAESSSQELLDAVCKNIRVDQIKNAARICREAGIKTLVFAIFGLPGETEEDRVNLLSFIKGLGSDFASFHKVVPYKGSRISGENIAPAGEIDRFLRRAILKYYFRPSYAGSLSLPVFMAGLRLFLGRIRS